MEQEMEKEFIFVRVEKLLKVNGKMIKEMDNF